MLPTGQAKTVTDTGIVTEQRIPLNEPRLSPACPAEGGGPPDPTAGGEGG